MPLGHAIADFIYKDKGIRSSPGRPFFSRSGLDSDDFSLRLAILRVVVLAVFLLLLSALLRLQIFQGSYFRALADGNRVREIPIHGPRGIIYDRSGVALVSNLPAFRLVVCGLSGQTCKSTIISKDQAITLEAQGLPSGSRLEVDSSRSYPQSAVTSHVLGYVSQASGAEIGSDRSLVVGDQIGRGGIEEAYEKTLRGKNGKELVEVDALGKTVRTLSIIPAVAGHDVHLSIDLSLQQVAFNAISDRKGAVVVSDPNNGSVLALVSAPSFDPNIFTDLSLTPEERELKLKNILSDKSQPLFDRAISGTYPPGSTFKIVTATAGLESGKITERTIITDPGILVIGQYKFPNWLYLRNGGTQGDLNVVSAIQKSNDIFFYRTGEWTGVDDLGRWAGRMGVDRKLGIDLPGEQAGNFPTELWRQQFKRDWYLGDTYHLAIGQGDLLVTPLQDNAWTSVVANGGKLCRPRLAFDGRAGGEESRGDCKDEGISKKTVGLVSQGLAAACSPGGTAWPLFNFAVGKKQVQIACKTGTAEYGDPDGKTHAWLTAYAPSDRPEIAVTVLIEGGGEGSDVAAPVVKKIMEAWFGR